MNEGSGDSGDSEAVGNLGEEAAKLLGALSQWSKDQARDQQAHAEGAAHGIADALRGVNEHLATGGEDCRYCPVCQVIHAVRDTNPEVKAHLASAASSFMHALAGMLETQHRGERPDPTSGVERIDLDADPDPGPHPE